MKLTPFALLLVAACFLSPARAETGGLNLEATESAYGMVTRSEARPVELTLTLHGGKPAPVTVVLTARDIFDRPIDWKQSIPVSAEAPMHLDFPGRPGFYAITAKVDRDPSVPEKTLELGIIPPPRPGLRPESFFASNTSGMKTGKDLEFLEAIGMKIQRVHFQPEPKLTQAEWKEPPAGKALPIDFTRQDKAFAELKAHGMWVLPVAGYALDASFGRTDLAVKLGMWGPPRDYAEFVNTWEEIIRHYPEIHAYEFWNEPWIFGWTWAAPPAEYRKLQKMWCEMALKVDPGLRIVAGNSSMFARDNIAPDPDCYKGLLQGTSQHPYSGVTNPAYRSGENRRSVDDGMDVTRRMGLPYYYLTEGGTSYAPPSSPERAAVEKRLAEILAKRRDFVTPEQKNSPEARALAKENQELAARLATLPEPNDNIENAAKIVQYYVNAALVGAFMGNAQWEIGYGPRWTRSNTSFAVMTHFLEDRPVVADIWPGQQLITGAIFASSKWVAPDVEKLPRAADLRARWKVPEDQGEDSLKVAVIWSLTGPDAQTLDKEGSLTIGDPGDIKAFDLTGREIPVHNGKLALPFGPNPVFLTTAKMSVVAFRAKIGEAALEKITPVNAYALSLAQPATHPQQLTVRLQNQINRDLSGTLSLRAPGAANPVTAPFSVPAGKLIELEVHWPGAAPSETNQYPIRLEATAGGLPSFSSRQIIEEARFVRRTIKIDGSLEDWKGATPVYIDSAQLDGSVDPTQYFLNPGMALPQGGKGRITARVYTAYDEANVYLAVAVNEPDLQCTAGEPVIKGRRTEKVALPYKSGMPDGLNHITQCGDVFQFAFGFHDRVPQAGRQMDDPYAWKGCFYDTDYCYAAYASKDGDEVMRLYGPDTSRCNGYQTEAVPGIGPVKGAQIKIRRDETRKETIYEMAIPRGEVAMFDPKSGRLRFGFNLYNDEKIGYNNRLSWSEAAGVFDYWLSAGSFPPNWTSSLPCQTFFGISDKP